jgi:hypothetical protein
VGRSRRGKSCDTRELLQMLPRRRRVLITCQRKDELCWLATKKILFKIEGESEAPRTEGGEE